MLSTRSRVAAGLVTVGTTSALLVPMAVPAQAAGVDLEAHMMGSRAFPGAHGKADYEAEHGTRHFDIEMHIARLHNRVVVVRVHGTFVGRMRVNSQGFGQLEKHSGVPMMAAGNVVRVRTMKGQLVSHGTLRPDMG